MTERRSLVELLRFLRWAHQRGDTGRAERLEHRIEALLFPEAVPDADERWRTLQRALAGRGPS